MNIKLFRVVILTLYQKHMEGLLNYRLLSSTPRIFWGLGWGLCICIPNKFSGDTNAAGSTLRTTVLD